MNYRRFLNSVLLMLLAFATTSAATSPLAARWTMGTNNAQPGYYSSRFVLTNVTADTLGRDWQFFFNQFSRALVLPDDCPVDMEEVSTSYYRITPNARYRNLASGDSLVIDVLMRGTMVNICYVPQGGHMVLGGDLRHPIASPIAIGLLDRPGQWIDRKDYPNGERMYALNERVNNIGDAYTGNDYDIFPLPKQIEIGTGFLDLSTGVKVKADEGAQRARTRLVDGLRDRGIPTGGRATTIHIRLNKRLSDNSEYYRLEVSKRRIILEATTEAGALNGVTTLLAALDHSHGNRLQQATIVDWPDFHYRGFMLDIARNFIPYDSILRFIDLLAYYKINTLQFHFTDDEAWRLDIAALPELTEVASRRGCTLDERDYLAQIFDGNGNPDDMTQSANGYLARAQMVALLRYAHARCIAVIPEIETPGHSRAAIVAMKARRARLEAAGRGSEFDCQLWDDGNTSQYTSAQSYHDNVLDVANEGVYRFLGIVVDELIDIYREAGLTLDRLHLGGDEVAAAAWDNSPSIAALMKRENLQNSHQVNEYYLRRVVALMQQRGISIGGWQEIALNHDAAYNEAVAPAVYGVNAWQTVGRNADIPHRVANAGYPVILSNVTNFYMDMAYNWHPYERGLHWGGAVDEFASWDALPWDLYRTARTDYNGNPIDLATAADGRLTLEHPENIIGVQAQLWGETLRGFSNVLYLCLPKLMGVTERAWNSRPEWATNVLDTAAYWQARHQYNLKIGTRELPLFHRWGLNFRVGQPGLRIVNGMLEANGPYPDVVIRYTLDGTEPTATSPRWTAPIPVPATTHLIKARAYYLGHSSVTSVLRLPSW